MKPFPFVKTDQLRTAAGIGISLLLHLFLLLLWSEAPLRKPSESSGSARSLPLVVELNRQPLETRAAPPAPTPKSQPQRSPQSATRPAPAKPKPERPVAKKQLAPRPSVPPRPTVPAYPTEERVAKPERSTRTAPAEAAPPADMSEMVAAARARRGATGIPAPDDAPRNDEARPQGDEVARANIARSIAQARGPSGAGGVFQITHKGVREASFLFRGWDSGNRSGLRELVQVDAGPGGNVETAIVRKMIELIRRYYPGDFSWNSHRLGRVVTLSARREDTAGLEEFLKKEFF
jgi:hypothetical protein